MMTVKTYTNIQPNSKHRVRLSTKSNENLEAWGPLIKSGQVPRQVSLELGYGVSRFILTGVRFVLTAKPNYAILKMQEQFTANIKYIFHAPNPGERLVPAKPGECGFLIGDIMKDLESDGYYHKCESCGYRFNYISDYCPDCGGEDIEEDGIILSYENE